ncbi:MAG: hypothetical protein SFU91_09500 [Chloroherpetonaceae bacterium]|nr:hypothetical protein [Chloroherpetonaceae bacterium]
MKRNPVFLAIMAAIFVAFSFSSCKDDNLSSTTDDTSVQATTEAAESVIGAVGSDNGGLNDQLTDLADLSINGGASFSSFSGSKFGFEEEMPSISANNSNSNNSTRHGLIRRRSYDSTSQYWTVTVVRNYSNILRSAAWTRQYKYRYSRNGVGQQFLRVNSTIADKIEFEIVSDSCSGSFKNPVVSHKLLGLEGKVEGVITLGTDTTMTINSTLPYKRSATDTVAFGQVKRVTDQVITMSLKDVVVRVNMSRRFRGMYSRPTSGTLTGNYKADRVVTVGDSTRSRSVNRDFTVDFSSDTTSDNFTLDIGGFGAQGLRFKGGLEDGMKRGN